MNKEIGQESNIDPEIERRPIHYRDKLAQEFKIYCKENDTTSKEFLSKLILIAAGREEEYFREIDLSIHHFVDLDNSPELVKHESRWLIAMPYQHALFGIDALDLALEHTLDIEVIGGKQKHILPYAHFTKPERLNPAYETQKHGIQNATFYILDTDTKRALAELVDKYK